MKDLFAKLRCYEMNVELNFCRAKIVVNFRFAERHPDLSMKIKHDRWWDINFLQNGF